MTPIHDQWIENSDDVKEYQNRYPYVYGVIFAAFILLVGRLWYLQILKGTDFKRLSQYQQLKEEKIPAPRGMVLDRNGQILVDSAQNFNVTLTPQYLTTVEKTAAEVGAVIKMDKQEIIDKVRASRKQNGIFKPVRIKENISRDEIIRIERMKIDHPGLNIETGIKRVYHLAENGAQLFGYTAEISKEELPVLNVGRSPEIRFRAGDIVGKAGLEKRWDTDLRAIDGARYVAVDANGRELTSQNNAYLGRLPEESEGAPGRNMTLTIDKDLQNTAYAVMKANKRIGSVVALDPNSGEILVMANAPAYDPNHFSTRVPTDIWMSLINDPFRPLRNKALQDHYAPGSVFKAIVAIAALQEKVISPYKTYFCPGLLRFGKRDYNCHIRHGHGYVNLYQALERSCDVYFYQVGLLLGIDRIAKYARLLGLGTRTGILLDNERSGLIPDEEWKKKTLGEVWQAGENLSNAIGQGFILVTPLQMALSYAAIATNGLLYKPFIVKRIQDNDGKIISETSPTLVADLKVPNQNGDFIGQNVFDAVKQGLSMVFNGPHGTARAYKIKGLELAGKTGTVQLFQLTRETVWAICENRDIKQRHHGWLVGFAPKNNPKIVVASLAEHSCHGTSAGPMLREVIINYFKKYAPEYLKDANLEMGIARVPGDE